MTAIYPRNPLSPPWDINAPWWYVLQAEAWAEELSRATWIEELKQRWHLVTKGEWNGKSSHLG